jgi:hypothetical protein
MRILLATAFCFLATVPLSAQTTLIARYRLDETSGTALVDEGPNNLSGSYISGYTLGVAAPINTGVEFAEILVGHADIANHPALASINSDISYCAWFRTSSVVGYRRVFASEDGGMGVGLFYNNLLFTTRGVQDYVQAANIQVNTWYHAAWIFDASLVAHFYLNGQLLGTVQGSGPALPSTNVFHVASRSASTELWDGAIDDIQIYQGALSAGDVSLIYQNPGLALNMSASTYCVAKTNSLTCTPQISATGAHNAFVPGGFTIRGSNVRNNKSGLLFYGISGQANTPFQGGTLCVKSQIKRTPGLNSGGTPVPANDCSGVYALDMGAFANGLLGGTPLPALNIPGQVVNAQFWGRDPGFPAPFNTTLTDALEWSVGL